jgi:molybdopterin-guanine dinucleotide biosynthesis protein A
VTDEQPTAEASTLTDPVVAAAWSRRPLLGGVLVGGSSRRMGQSKAIVPFRGRALAEHVVLALEAHVDEVVLVGDGPVPASIAGNRRLADASDCAGPLAGLLAALRAEPRAAWIVAACDLPLVTDAAVAWLLAQRAPGRWAIVPSLEPGLVEPLLAVYEPQSRHLLERLATSGMAAPHRIAREATVHCPQPPPSLAPAWRNINTPEELRAAEAESEGGRKG